jgi:beta-phosphoglucomutase-like phosphatase (HAD superfamily)
MSQDGTLTDSISAVEAAWGKVAKDIGQDPEYVIAATHGKRAIDNLSQFKPELQSHEMDAEVERFENTILYYADAYNMHSGGNTPASGARSRAGSFVQHPGATISNLSSAVDTPELTPASTAPSSRRPSVVADAVRRPSFTSRLLNMLSIAARLRVQEEHQDTFIREGEDMIHTISEEDVDKAKTDALEAWQLEAASVDRSVQILPGVKKMIASIPDGRYAVATSGAKTYGTPWIYISL